MRNFLKFPGTLEVAGLQRELFNQPDLWNTKRFRTEFEGTPHREVDDIWLRFSPIPDSVESVINDSGAVWYPEVERLPSVRPLVLTLLMAVGGYSLERLLITRLAPGKRILPHADIEGTYVNLPDIRRYHVVIQGLRGSQFTCGDETVQMLTGEVWQFDPRQVHHVLNASSDDRIHLLVDCKVWP